MLTAALSGEQRSGAPGLYRELPRAEAPRDHFLWSLVLLLYVVVLFAYGLIFWNCARHIGGTRAGLDSITFLGLPPQYNMDDPLQQTLAPLVYAVMHANLLTFALLPLPMCRCTIRRLSASPTLSAILHIDHAHYWHRILGYLLMGGVLLGGVFWWFCFGYGCAERGVAQSCEAFHPRGSYTNFYSNGAAVLFLRQLVVTGLVAIFFSAALVYPLEAGAKALRFGWWQDHAFEIFYYTHVLSFVAIAGFAFTSRFAVFYPAAPMWAWYGEYSRKASCSFTRELYALFAHPPA